MAKRPTALGAYIFAGGFTVGVKKHFDVLAHFEQGDYGVASAKANWPDLPIYHDLNSWPVKQYKGKVDFIYSNPPCAAWSAAGRSTAAKWETDNRVDCARRSFQLIGEIRPKVWCWESVARAYSLGRPLVDQFTKEALEMGYSVTHLLVEATKLGVPQRRNRFFMVVHNVALPFEKPNFKKMTVADAFKQVKVVGDYQALDQTRPWFKHMKDLKQGDELRHLFDMKFPHLVAAAGNGPVQHRPSFQVRRLISTEPSNTLTGGATLIHPTEHRHISINESKALCGYPQNFKFVGNLGKQYAQVAQAVMPPVGAWLSGIVAKGLEARKPDTGSVHLVDLRPDEPIFYGLGKKGTYPAPQLPPMGPRLPRMPRDPSIPRMPRVKQPFTVPPRPAKVIPLIPTDQGQSGRYIRRLLRMGKLSDIEIVAQVHANFPGRKTTTSDVNWNKGRIKEGFE